MVSQRCNRHVSEVVHFTQLKQCLASLSSEILLIQGNVSGDEIEVPLAHLSAKIATALGTADPVISLAFSAVFAKARKRVRSLMNSLLGHFLQKLPSWSLLDLYRLLGFYLRE
jgi:hypothetical protein